MPAIHVVQQVLRFADESSLCISVVGFRELPEAQKACQARQKALAERLGLRIVRVNAAGEGEDTGQTLGQALAEFGVVGFTHRTDSIEVEDARIQLATSMPRLA